MTKLFFSYFLEYRLLYPIKVTLHPRFFQIRNYAQNGAHPFGLHSSCSSRGFQTLPSHRTVSRTWRHYGRTCQRYLSRTSSLQGASRVQIKRSMTYKSNLNKNDNGLAVAINYWGRKSIATIALPFVSVFCAKLHRLTTRSKRSVCSSQTKFEYLNTRIIIIIVVNNSGTVKTLSGDEEGVGRTSFNKKCM